MHSAIYSLKCDQMVTSVGNYLEECVLLDCVLSMRCKTGVRVVCLYNLELLITLQVCAFVISISLDDHNILNT